MKLFKLTFCFLSVHRLTDFVCIVICNHSKEIKRYLCIKFVFVAVVESSSMWPCNWCCVACSKCHVWMLVLHDIWSMLACSPVFLQWLHLSLFRHGVRSSTQVTSCSSLLIIFSSFLDSFLFCGLLRENLLKGSYELNGSWQLLCFVIWKKTSCQLSFSQ